MKIVTGALAAVLLAGIGWPTTAQAQGTPQGSYLRSCSNVSAGGDTLTATCRRENGREQRTALSGFRRCAGDIGNNNGILECSIAGGGQLRGQFVGGEQRGEPQRGEQRGAPPYGEPPRGGPGYGGPGYEAPGYGGPGYGRPGYGGPGRGGPGGPSGDWAARCGGLHREAEELRSRLEREFNPIERARTEGRLREIREQEARCR
jgi:hypothetical protein